MSNHPHPATRSLRKEKGFSLIELMVVITITAVLATLGMPSFSKFILGQRAKTASFDLAIALLLARSEAVKRNVDITVSPSVLANGWVGGWQVSYVGAPGPVSTQAAYSGISIAGPVANSVTYQGSSGRPSAGTKLYFTITGGNTVRCVTIDVSGMTSTRTGACS